MRHLYTSATSLRISSAAILLWFTAAHQLAIAIELPNGGINLAGYSYYGTELPFVDVAHMGGGWSSALASSWNPPDKRVITTSTNGYPASLAPDQIAFTVIFTHNGGIYPTGNYVLRWKGTGDVRLSMTGGAPPIHRAPNEATYRITKPDQLGIYLKIFRTSETDPVHDISVHAPFAGDANGVFNPKFKEDLKNYGVIRFMDWNMTNNSVVEKWSDRVLASDCFWGGSKGVPYEYQIQLSNETDKDIWLTVPHLADDDYVARLARLVKEKLKPNLRVWVEYSNEVWNGGFKQSKYANEVLRPRYGLANGSQAYGRRSAEIFDIFTKEFADPRRVVRVLAGQAVYSGVLEQALIGATVDGKLKADVAAVAPYFLVDVDKLYQRHLAGTVDLNEVYPELHRSIDSVLANVAKNQALAAKHGLPLVSYEGGQHLVARPGEQHNNQSFVDLLQQINRDPRMGDAYAYLLDKWYGLGGKTFTFFNDVGPGSKWGYWGMKENYLDSNAIKFVSVQRYLEHRASDQGQK